MSTETGNIAALMAVRKKAKGIKGEAFTLLEGMAYLCDENMVCSAPPKAIAEEGKVETTSLKRLTDRLKELGFIEQISGGPGNGNHKTYRVFPESRQDLNLADSYVSERGNLAAGYDSKIQTYLPNIADSMVSSSPIGSARTGVVEGEDLLHKSSLDGWKVNKPGSSQSVQPPSEKISVQDFEITADQKLVTDAICDVSGRNPNDLSQKDFDGMVSSLMVIEESEPGATGAEKAEQVRRRFTAPSFDLPNPPSPKQVGQWWAQNGTKLKHREALKSNPAAMPMGGRGQPKNEKEAQFVADLAALKNRNHGHVPGQHQ